MELRWVGPGAMKCIERTSTASVKALSEELRARHACRFVRTGGEKGWGGRGIRHILVGKAKASSMRVEWPGSKGLTKSPNSRVHGAFRVLQSALEHCLHIALSRKIILKPSSRKHTLYLSFPPTQPLSLAAAQKSIPSPSLPPSLVPASLSLVSTSPFPPTREH